MLFALAFVALLQAGPASAATATPIQNCVIEGRSTLYSDSMIGEAFRGDAECVDSDGASHTGTFWMTAVRKRLSGTRDYCTHEHRGSGVIYLGEREYEFGWVLQATAGSGAIVGSAIGYATILPDDPAVCVQHFPNEGVNFTAALSLYEPLIR